MTKVKIDGIAAIRRPSDDHAQPVENETIELSTDDELVADGPVGITIVEE